MAVGLSRPGAEPSHASRAHTSIEINGSYYSRFKPDSWRKWRDEAPNDFVFAVKASRYCTNRKILSEAGQSIDSFLTQGLTVLGTKLGPINWQFMATKKFDPQDIAAFMALLPKEKDSAPLRHVLGVRHPSFLTQDFHDLARANDVAIAYAQDDEFPQSDEPTSSFTYARLLTTSDDLDAGISPADTSRLASKLKAWSKHGDVFAHFISGAKIRNPAADQQLIAKLNSGHQTGPTSGR